MTQVTPDLIADLKRDEGLRLEAYPDPVSHGDPWTIGYGHTGGISSGVVWTENQASDQLLADASRAASGVLTALPWVATLDSVRQDALYNMAFNLGVNGLIDFPHTLDMIKSGQWARAVAAMMASTWASEVGQRATRLAHMILTGQRA